MFCQQQRRTIWTWLRRHLALFLLAIVFIVLVAAVSFGSWTPFEAVVVLTALAAFMVSILTVRELRNQRRDSQKPLVVPHGSGTQIWPLFQTNGHVIQVNIDSEMEYDVQLKVKNIGSGPASNISMNIEQRLSVGEIVKSDIDITSVTPLGIGDKAHVYHRGSSGFNNIDKGYWLIITYDDIFNNHFKTECQWSGNAWHAFKTESLSK